MSKIKDLYYIKDILNNEDGTIHNGETGYYSVDTKPFDSTYGTIYLPKADVNYYYNALKEVFDLEFSPINTYGIVIFADTQVDRLIIYSRSQSSVYLDYNANIGLYWFSNGPSDCYVYDMQTKTLTSYGSVPNNRWWSATINSDWLYTGRYKVLYTADVDYYQMNGMLYSNQNINYLNIESKQGYGPGGWQVPNPNPTRKIIINGSEPDDIKLNGVTPDKIMLNGQCYFEKPYEPTLVTT